MKHWYAFAIVGLCLLLERTNCAPQFGAFAQASSSKYVVREQSVARVAKVEINNYIQQQPYYVQPAQQQPYYQPTTGRSNTSGGRSSGLLSTFTNGLRALTGGLFG
uniref:Uncharacterized protein n=1 Tax=Anopheles arabiensis TaxID=7173 RepID=A0A182HWV7_ANOAR